MWRWIFAVLFLVSSVPAWAARVAVVDADEVAVLEFPNKNAKVVEKLKRNSSVTASNFPTGVFYKVRTGTGSVGWILGQTLILKESSVTVDAEKKVVQRPTASVPKSIEAKRVTTSSDSVPSFQIRTLGGGTVFNSSNVIPGYVFSQGYSFGLELGYFFLDSFTWVIRGEKVFKDGTLSESNGTSFQVSLGSLPVMTGLEAEVLRFSNFSANIAILGGLALQTQIQSFNSTSGDRQAMISSSNPLTGIAKINLIWNLFDQFNIYVEGGYRYLKSSTLSAPSGTLAQIITLTPSIDFSGPTAAAGLSLKF